MERESRFLRVETVEPGRFDRQEKRYMYVMAIHTRSAPPVIEIERKQFLPIFSDKARARNRTHTWILFAQFLADWLGYLL